jgi:hypothetical protein
MRNPFLEANNRQQVKGVASSELFQVSSDVSTNGEPQCAEYFRRKDDVPVQDAFLNNPGGDPLTERRAHFGFSEGARTVLLDCTTSHLDRPRLQARQSCGPTDQAEGQ